jgi:hypothetical protein
MDDFTGKWVGDRRCGFGKLESKVGNSYEGGWENNLYHGQGSLVLKDGFVHLGAFKMGKRHGPGKILLPNSENVTFEGEWVEDEQQQ